MVFLEHFQIGATDQRKHPAITVLDDGWRGPVIGGSAMRFSTWRGYTSGLR